MNITEPGSIGEILIVDDTRANLQLLSDILSDAGYKVRPANNGELALRSVKAKLPDLILLDIKMSGMDGIEVCRQLKADEKTSPIPVIFISVLEDEASKIKGFQAGAVDFVTKPFYSEELLARVKTHLSINQLQSELKSQNAQLLREIAERKQAEEALRESETKYRRVSDNSPAVLYQFMMTPDGAFSFPYVSDAVEATIGISAEEIMKDSSKFLGMVHPEDQEMFRESIMKSAESLESFPLTFRCMKDGGEIWMEARGTPAPLAGGGMLWDGFLIDITERKQIEEELLRAKKFESLGVLAGGISHEFNNALTAITGNTELLEMDYPQDEKILNHAKTMKQSAHRMAHLTSQLLAYAGGGKYDPQPRSLSKLLEGALPLIQHTLDPDIRLETDFPLNVLNVKIDHTQMQMVLSALMINSNEAIEPPGRIRISTRNIDLDQESIKGHPGLKPGPHVCLSIEDDGKGMDEETRERIFEPFFTTNFVGRGLGMASVYGIVTNHDGSISVDSEPGKGTTVTIYLPALEAKEEVKEEVEERIVSSPAIDLPMGEGTVLVIEDEATLVALFRKILEMLGYRVLEAMTGREAVEIAKAFDGQIDLALLDIKLPDMSGNQIYPLIMEARPDLKVIVCSGYSIDGPAQEILDAGAEGFIQKPFLIAPFADKLKEVLEGRSLVQSPKSKVQGRMTNDQ